MPAPARQRARNYERLEFLGDRVLGLCVAELLFSTFGAAAEGELSVRLNQLVSAETCAEVADEIELHRFIRTGADVKKLDGQAHAQCARRRRRKPDRRRFISMAGWRWRAASSCATGSRGRRVADGARRDAKTELQEWAHAKFGVTPVYRVDDRSGPDHDPRFTVTVEVAGVAARNGQWTAPSAPPNRRLRPRLLVREGVWHSLCSETDGQND